MTGQIRRTTGPQPLQERTDGEFTWTVPVSAVPSVEWMRLFNMPREPDEVCMPSRVDVRDRGLVFVATEARIQQWMRHIDQWIATARLTRASVLERSPALRRERLAGRHSARARGVLPARNSRRHRVPVTRALRR